MAVTMATTTRRTATKRSAPRKTEGESFSADERAAMKARSRELKGGKKTGADAVLAALAEMPAGDRAMGERRHAIINETAPSLSPKTWYGMPAYANAGGKVICFFQGASKFKARYATFGFNDDANLDDGNMWPTSFALKKLTSREEATIRALVKKAVG
jgi:uncharacterized protein YdhG (YjbR/CyaY superfamily)